VSNLLFPTAKPTPVTADLVRALGRLNGHARAYGNGKRAIYAYKMLAAAVALTLDGAKAELVQWTGQCGHCGGTGRYVDSYGEKWPHCRQCASTGTVTLKFVETVLFDGQVWHHPWKYDSGIELAEIAGIVKWDGHSAGWIPREPVFWNVGGGWAPQQPGERLVPDEAADLLNTVEAWVLASVLPQGDKLHWIRERALREMRGYVLDLGRVGLRCWYCESPEIHVGLGRPGPPFAWSAAVCREHSNLSPAEWPNVLPEWMMTPPLVEWKRRHDRLGYDRETIFGW
jgi:hypothetical protein